MITKGETEQRPGVKLWHRLKGFRRIKEESRWADLLHKPSPEPIKVENTFIPVLQKHCSTSATSESLSGGQTQHAHSGRTRTCGFIKQESSEPVAHTITQILSCKHYDSRICHVYTARAVSCSSSKKFPLSRHCVVRAHLTSTPRCYKNVSPAAYFSQYSKIHHLPSPFFSPPFF